MVHFAFRIPSPQTQQRVNPPTFLPMASSSASAIPSTLFSRFTLFLEDTPHEGNEEVLHSFFTRTPDLATTVDLHVDAFAEIVAYMEQHIMRYAVSIPPHDGLWVPCDLLRYIHKGDRPFTKRLKRFQEIAAQAGHFLDERAPGVPSLKKRKLGLEYLSRLATFIFFVSEEPDSPEVRLPHLQIGAAIKDSKEPDEALLNSSAEGAICLREHPQGLYSLVDNPNPTPTECPLPEEAPPTDEAIPEVEVSQLSSVVVDGGEFVFLHDLEKAFAMRMDECLSVLCTKAEIDIDSAPDALDTKLLPLGDSVAETVALVCQDVMAADQALVTEEEFKATQALVMASYQPNPPPPVLSKLVDAAKSSIDLDAKGNREEEDKEQEVSFHQVNCVCVCYLKWLLNILFVSGCAGN